MAELNLALFVLADGKSAVVKGQITGSIIDNGLLGLGLAILAGSWGRTKQTFLRHSVAKSSLPNAAKTESPWGSSQGTAFNL